jgi:hypothetical protein
MVVATADPQKKKYMYYLQQITHWSRRNFYCIKTVIRVFQKGVLIDDHYEYKLQW